MDGLITRTVLGLAAAKRIMSAAEGEADRNGWAVAIAIVDEAGRLLLFQRMDGAPNASVEVAIRKATHAVNYRRDTRFHQDLVAKGHHAVLGLPEILPVEGGVRLLYGEAVIGGIGVSGAQSAQDGQIAAAGAGALGAPAS
jgi:glc operon protein GlcG